MDYFTLPKDSKCAVVRLTGRVEDDSDLSKIVLNSHPVYEFDLSGLTSINSRGVRAWFLWMKGLDQARSYIFMNCPSFLISNASLFSGFFPKWVKVRSVLVPYACGLCGNYFSETKEIDDTQLVAPHLEDRLQCPKCSSKAELDVDPGRFFGFLVHR